MKGATIMPNQPGTSNFSEFTQQCLDDFFPRYFTLRFKYPDMDAPCSLVWSEIDPVFDPHARLIELKPQDRRRYTEHLTGAIKAHDLGRMMRFATECMKCQPGLKFWVVDSEETTNQVLKVEQAYRTQQAEWQKPYDLPGVYHPNMFFEPGWWSRRGMYYSYVIGIGRNGKWYVRDQYKELISYSTVGKFPYFEQ